ncbi:MAG TPA: XdhC family protein [Burkholderiaceae bacterium]|nr:XdhC family protein [Burkholderiaceae bacterium]
MGSLPNSPNRADQPLGQGQAPTIGQLLQLAQELCLRGESFAMVTVVRAVAPSSATAGAQAIVRSDGTLYGWIGGGCTKQVVVDAALETIRRATPRLVHIGNDDQQIVADVESHRMPCASNGEVELFLHPFTPAPLLLVLGTTPVAQCARAFAQQVGFRVTEDCEGTMPQLALVATQGDGDEVALQAALASSAQHVLLIASARKAQRLREELSQQGIGEQQLARLEAPAGPDIGARTPAQIALAAVAGALAWWQRAPTRELAPASSLMPSCAVSNAPPAGAQHFADPVCGMLIDVAKARHMLDYEGTRFYFCCEGCRLAFAREPARYVTGRAGVPQTFASGMLT